MNIDFEQARFNMIEQQIRPWEVLDPEVLGLLSVVRREDFVPEAYRALAFADLEIPLPGGQCMLAPKVEARLLQEAAVKKTDKVLEIGAGSGHMAALLAAQAEYVQSIEIDPALAALARKNLQQAGVANASVEIGDGACGWAKSAPYDVIVVSGSLPQLPELLLEQLRLGGRLVAIVGSQPIMSAQLVTRATESTFNTVNLFETVAAPLSNAAKKSAFAF